MCNIIFGVCQDLIFLCTGITNRTERHIMSKLLTTLSIGLLLFTSCQKREKPEEILPETPKGADTIHFTNATVTYYGGALYSGEADLWEIDLYTDMEENEEGEKVGPGFIVRLSMHTAFDPEQKGDITQIDNSYMPQSSPFDYSAGTFVSGYIDHKDSPYGYLPYSAGTFFGCLSSGESDFEADLLREGEFEIISDKNGNHSISGRMVGSEFKKRFFTFDGKLEAKEPSDESYPNSNITEDMDLSSYIARLRVSDHGDSYFIGEGTYRHYKLILADENVNLEKTKPSGNGRMLVTEFFVPWESKPEEGLPEGEYTVVPQDITGGIYKEDIVPFGMIPGFPDAFSRYSGCWYIMLENDIWREYARIVSGKMTVERDGKKHNIRMEFTECSDTPLKITCTLNGITDIAVY